MTVCDSQIPPITPPSATVNLQQSSDHPWTSSGHHYPDPHSLIPGGIGSPAASSIDAAQSSSSHHHIPLSSSSVQMSSYQFVNSLTSCYGGPRGPGGDVTGPPQAPQDYYNAQAAYATGNWNGGTGGSGMNPGVANNNPYSAYLGGGGINGDHGVGGHGVGGHNLNSAAHHHHAAAGAYNPNAVAAAACNQAAVAAAAAARLGHSMGFGGTTVGAQLAAAGGIGTPGGGRLNAAGSPSSSCKYGGLDSAASPQDLSTSSGGAGQSPDPHRGPPGSPSHHTQVRTNSTSGSSQTNTSSGAPPPHGGGHHQQAHHGQTNNSSTTQSNSKNANNQQSNSNSQPPHIYPWMRKVHVGSQSKSRKLKPTAKKRRKKFFCVLLQF